MLETCLNAYKGTPFKNKFCTTMCISEQEFHVDLGEIFQPTLTEIHRCWDVLLKYCPGILPIIVHNTLWFGWTYVKQDRNNDIKTEITKV